MRYFLLLILLCISLVSIQAQDESISTTAFQQLFVYEGPGRTHNEVGRLNPGIEVVIVERNHTGTWVRVNMLGKQGEVNLDGWVVSSYLNYPPDMSYADIPINKDLPDANPNNVESESLAELYTAQIIPTLSDEMVEVYELGQELGNESDVITKIGDSLSASTQYLTPFSRDDYILGPYDYLETALLYYGKSAADDSIAAQIGMSSYAVFDSFWANNDDCEPNESPLTCEYRLKQPSIAFIMFGPNDVRSMDDEQYAGQMRQIVEETLEAGIIPVISTFSVDPNDELYWQAINFNLQLLTIADEYQIPLINLWAATTILPDYGLDEDHIHLKHSGFNNLKYDSGHEIWYGLSLQNLLALRTLHEIYMTLGIGAVG